MQLNINQLSEKFHCFLCTNFCMYLGSQFVWLTLDLNWALDSIDEGENLFSEHCVYLLVFRVSIEFLERLLMYESSKCLAFASI